MSTTLTNQDLTASNKAAALKAEADAKKRAAAILAQQKALTKAAKDSALVKKASAIFDLAQIQIVAALKGKLSEEDKKRLELQQAILSGNADEVVRVANELANVQGKTKELSIWLKDLPTAKNPFQDWMAYLDEIAKKVASLGVPVAGYPTPPYASPVPVPVTNNPMLDTRDYSSGGMTYATGASGATMPVINVQVQVAGQDVAAVVSSQQETQSQSGGSGGSWSGVRVL